jgi:hypothetical protein
MWTKEQQSVYYKEWRKNKKEKLAEYHKIWSKINKEYLAEYHEENKEHIAQIAKEWRDNHPEKIKKLWEEWYKKNPKRSIKRRFTEAVNKAKKRGIFWDLTLEQYLDIVVLPCDYCQNKIGTPVIRSVGLDRKDSNIGYTLDNVVSCCYACNVMKNVFITYEEMKFIVFSLLKYRELKLSTQTQISDHEILDFSI